MYIRLTSLFVKDQEQALQFYTGILGFKVKNDIPLGEHRWLTVVSPHEPDGTELVLEPMAFESARVYQAKLFEDGMIQIRRRPPFVCSCLKSYISRNSKGKYE